MANLAVPIPRTFTPGEAEVGSYFNAGVRDLGTFLLNPPIAQLVQNTIQSIPNSAVTPLTFDGTINDSYGGHSNVTNNSRYTGQVTGWYLVAGVAAFATNGTGVRVARLRKNGSDIIYFDVWAMAVSTASTPTAAATAGIVQLNAGDYVELAGYQTSGGALNTIVAGPQSGMAVFWLHA